jgi:hypothetical protein
LNTNDTFAVDTVALAQAVNALRDADSQEEKSSSLESLTRLLFEGIPFLTCKYVNSESIGSELEVVVQYNGRNPPTVFDAFGRYFLLHGKDWSAAVRTKDLTALLEKMQKSRVRLGIILAPLGICGRRKGGQAVREIRRAFDVHGVCTVVLCAEHLRQVVGGANFYDMLEYLIERTRFDFV